MPFPSIPHPFESDETPPELGPRLLFFTGGTALRGLSRELIDHTHNSVHLVTPFDSGGSSAMLRSCIAMPAVGDLRNRLLALADRRVVPSSVLDICNMRLPRDGDRQALLQTLYGMASARDAVWRGVPRVFGEALRVHLRYFLEQMPETFDPRGASLGNLIMAGGFLHHGRRLEPVLLFLSRLLRVRGVVLPTVHEDLHLMAELADGSVIVGQHRITGKDAPAIASPIRRLAITRRLPAAGAETVEEYRSPLSPLAATYIATADLICYPMGSFWTSVVANLLPVGVGGCVAQADCPKVYIPNVGDDPEQLGMSVAAAVAVLLATLRRDAGSDAPASQLLQSVLVDTRAGEYRGGLDAEGIRAQGVTIIDRPLIDDGASAHAPKLVAQALFELAARKDDGMA